MDFYDAKSALMIFLTARLSRNVTDKQFKVITMLLGLRRLSVMLGFYASCPSFHDRTPSHDRYETGLYHTIADDHDEQQLRVAFQIQSFIGLSWHCPQSLL